MSLLLTIQEILRQECICVNASGEFIMEEPGSSACKEVKVEIKGKVIGCRFNYSMPFGEGNSLVELNPHFQDKTHVKRMCDYIYFYQHKENDPKFYVLLCELKGSASYMMQLRAGYSFARFIIDAARRHAFSKTRDINENVIYNAIAFKPNSSYKYPNPKTPLNTFKMDNLSHEVKVWEFPCKGVGQMPFNLSHYAI